MKLNMKNPILPLCFMIYCINGLSQTNVDLRINAGGTEVTNQDSTYLTDQYYTGGSITSNNNIGLVPPFKVVALDLTGNETNLWSEGI